MRCGSIVFLVLSMFLALSAAVGPSEAAEINVPGDFPTIQGAIAAASNGDVIIVAPGTYSGTVNPVGKAITIRSVDPTDPMIVDQTILEGNGERVIVFFYGERLDTVVDGFTIRGGLSDQGGGIGIFASDPVVRRCVIRENRGKQGGGAYVYASSALFDECTFTDNFAQDGGAVFAYAGTYVRFDACEFTDNVAASDGGAVSSTFSSLRFEGCLVAGNSADDFGGAFDSDNTVALFVSSLIRDNVAARGGAIRTDDDSPRLLNTTVVRNSAVFAGGAIFGIMSQPIIRNSIVRDNSPNEFAGFALNPTAEYSNVSGGLPGPGNIDADPLFVDPDADDFRLEEDSPSVNSGFNGWIPSYAIHDLGREPRLRDETVDMGAYEFQIFLSPKPVAFGSLIVAFRDDGSLADGLESPLLRYDVSTGAWIKIVRNLPSYAITSDYGRRCFWIHSGENGLLGRVPYDTLELEEIGVLKVDGSAALGLSGMAVRDGVVYGTAWLAGMQPDRLYTVDTETATLTLIHEFPIENEIWDLHYDAPNDRMLVLSSPEIVPPGPVGIYELDLMTFDLTLVQPYFKDKPTELNALQGLATGQGRNFIFRSPYNTIEIFDARTQKLIETTSVPDFVPRPGAGWLFGGLTWAPPERRIRSVR